MTKILDAMLEQALRATRSEWFILLPIAATIVILNAAIFGSSGLAACLVGAICAYVATVALWAFHRSEGNGE